jgi:hypothetical protein
MLSIHFTTQVIYYSFQRDFIYFRTLVDLSYVGILSVSATSTSTIGIKISNSNLITGAAFPYMIQVSGGKAAMIIDKSFLSASSFSGTGSFVSAVSSATMSVAVTSSTLSGTSTAPQAFTWASSSTGSLSLVRCTAAYFTGDIITISAGTTVTVTLTSNILGSGITGSLGDTATLPTTGVTSGGYNVIWKSILPTGVAQTSDQIGISPLISSTPSSPNNSFTQVYTLQSCSPAINDGSPDTTITVDQINDNRTLQTFSDSGAYESNLLPCVYVTNPNVTLNSSKDGIVAFNVTFHVSGLYTESQIQVSYTTADGTAVANVDYNPISSTLQWAIGATAGIAPRFEILSTSYYKPTLYFYVNLTLPSTTHAILTTPQLIITIKNTNPLPTLTLSRVAGEPPNFAEGGAADFTLTANIASSLVMSVTLTYTGTAVAGVNYNVTYNVTIPATQKTASFSVQSDYNPVCEGNKNLSVSLTSPVNAVLGTGSSIFQSFTIFDIDTCYVSFETPSVSVNEGSGLLALNFFYNLPTSSSSSFEFVIYGPTNLYTVVSPAGSLVNVQPYQITGNITLNITRDYIYKATPVELEVALGNLIGIVGNVTDEYVTINNVDPEPTISIVSSVTSTNETSASFPFSLVLSGETDQNVTFSLIYSGKSLSINNIVSPSTLQQSVTIVSPQTVYNLTVPLQQNFMCGSGNLNVAIDTTSVQNANLSTNLNVSVAILDVDQCFLTLQQSSVTKSEGVGLVQLPFVLNLPLVDPSSFTYTINASTVNLYAGGNDMGFEMSNIIIPNRTTSGSITLNLTRDYVHQEVTPSTLLVTLSGFNDLLRAGAITQETVNVTDIDPNPTLALQISTTDVSENIAAPVVLTLTLSVERSNALNVSLTYTGNYNFTNNLQDPLSLPSQITFAPMQTVYMINVTLKQNNLCGDQSMSVQIDQSSLPPSGNTDSVSVGTTSVSLTIRNVDVCAVSFELTNVTVDEASGTLTLPFTLSNPSMQSSFFSVSVTGSQFLYDLITPSPITLDPYQPSGNITLNITHDSIHQQTPISQLTVKVFAFSSTVTSGNITQEYVYVVDIDPVPSVSLSVSSGPSVQENSGSPVTVTFTLSGATATPVNFSLVYGGDTNVNNNIMSAPQTITFQTLQTSTTGLIYVKDNSICGSQNLTVQINGTSLMGAVLSNNTDGDLTILDVDQCLVSFVSSQQTVEEGSGPLTLYFTLSLPSLLPTNFSFNVTSPPNLLGLLENTTTTTIQLAPLQTNGSFTVNVGHDYVHQAVSPTLTYVTIYGFSSTIGGGTTTQDSIYVIDEDPAVVASIGGPSSSSIPSSISEISSTPINITVYLNTPTSLTINVSLTYTGGGVNNLDNPPQQITFAPMQQQQTISIYMQQNNICGNQSLTISINASIFTNALINSSSSSTQVLVTDVSVCTAAFQCDAITTSFMSSGIIITLPLYVNQPSSMMTNTAFATSENDAGGSALQITNVTASPIVLPPYSVNSSVVLQLANQQTYQPTRNLSIYLVKLQNSLPVSMQTPCYVQIPSLVPQPSLFFSVSGGGGGGSVISNLTITVIPTQETTFTLSVGLTTPSYQSISFAVTFSGTAKFGVDYVISTSSSRKKSLLDTNDNSTSTSTNTTYTYTIGASQSSVQFQLIILNTTSSSNTSSVLYAQIGAPTNAVLSPALSKLTVQIGAGAPTLAPTLSPTSSPQQIIIVQTSNGLSEGALIGIIIGAFVLLVLIIVVIILIVKNRNKKQDMVEMTIVTD